MKRRRGARSRRAFDWKRLPKIVLLGGGAVAVGWLAVKSATVEALGRKNPAAAAAIAPGDPRLPMTVAMAEFRQKSGNVSAPVSAAAIAALQNAPLAEEPFLLGGLAALIAEREEAADPLLAEARRRNPRSRVARLLLLDRFLRTGKVAQAAEEITTLSRLMPEARGVLIPEIAKFAVDPKTSGALAEVLRTDPDMRLRVLDHLAGKGIDPDRVLRLASASGSVVSTDGSPDWHRFLLNNMIDKGELARARALWSTFSGVEQSKIEGGVYDGRFQRLPGPPPFNWRFTSGSGGVAEPTRAPALQVEYYGRENIEFASQMLSLPPGRHQLAIRASGETPGTGGSISWKLACHPSNVEIATLPIMKLSFTPRILRGSFIVPPSGCSAQWLRLVGMPAEFPAAQSVTIADLTISKAGGS